MAEKGQWWKKKSVLSGAAGAFDPALEKLARKLASLVPENSIFRSTGIRSVVGTLKGFAEEVASKFGILPAIAVEKITDFFDFFAGAVAGQKPATAGVTKDSGIILEAADGWMKKFFEEAGGRLKNAADKIKEFDDIELEFEMRVTLLTLMDSAAKELAPKPSEEPIKTTGILEKTEASWKKFKEASERFNQRMDNLAENINSVRMNRLGSRYRLPKPHQPSTETPLASATQEKPADEKTHD